MTALADIATLHAGRAQLRAPGVRAPTRLALWQARALVEAAIVAALAREREWQEPIVAPRLDGGVDLGWKQGGRLLLCTLLPEDEGGVWLIRRGGATNPLPRRLERAAAVEQVVRALPKLPGPIQGRKPVNGNRAPLYPDAEVRRLREAHQAGASVPELARAGGMGERWVRQVVTGQKRLAAGGPIAGRGGRDE